MTTDVGPVPAPGCAVYVYYADGLSVGEVFSGPGACYDAAAFVTHSRGLAGVVAIWRVRHERGDLHVTELLWRPDPAGPLRPVSPG